MSAIGVTPPARLAARQAYLSTPDAIKYAHVDRILDRPGPSTAEEFNAGDGCKRFLRDACKILVIGAGGLGCEILQNLALMGFRDIHVIDMDTIDVSNLNRQFLFRESDIGKSKAVVAAEFVMRRVPGCLVTPYFGKIQDHGTDYYSQFNLLVTGLDSIEARRWMNATLVGMVDPEIGGDSLKPMVDGGTEGADMISDHPWRSTGPSVLKDSHRIIANCLKAAGFKGQARVILPTISSCYECSIDMLTPPTAFPICTIANTPRLPEHCIEWASVLEWPKVFKDKKLDNDDPEHIEWLYQQALSRAAEFKIEGVTWSLTQGVVKNIIPAIASTNAVIAAACCNEAFKIATSSAPMLGNYMMYVGNESLYTYTFKHRQRKNCPVCGGESIEVEVGRDWTLEKLVDWLIENQNMQIKKPSLSGPDDIPLFFQAPPPLYEATKGNLEKTLDELIKDGDALVVTDRSLPFTLTLIVKFKA